LVTPPPPVRDRAGRVLYGYAFCLGLSEEPLLGSLPLGRLAVVLRSVVVLTAHPRLL
jgi:hypothetical protein